MAAANASNSPWTPGDEIRKARKGAGMKQEELALAIGVSRPTLSKWERGLSKPRIDDWREIVRVTGATWLLGSQTSSILNPALTLIHGTPTARQLELRGLDRATPTVHERRDRRPLALVATEA